jgi:putative intracellular protease/amidase
MQIAIPLYPRFTALDAVGPYTVLAFAPDIAVTFVAAERGPVIDDKGQLTMEAASSFDEMARPDVIVVPGGPGTRAAMSDRRLLRWIAEAHEHTRVTASVCSGALVLGAAGLLQGRSATTHWGWLQYLKGLGAVPVAERVVIDGRLMTAAGVSAGIDMGLTLLATLTSAETAQTVQLAIEYDPRPPFQAGSPHSAPPGMAKHALGLIS